MTVGRTLWSAAGPLAGLARAQARLIGEFLQFQFP
jgi:hypothetical protein